MKTRNKTARSEKKRNERKIWKILTRKKNVIEQNEEEIQRITVKGKGERKGRKSKDEKKNKKLIKSHEERQSEVKKIKLRVNGKDVAKIGKRAKTELGKKIRKKEEKQGMGQRTEWKKKSTEKHGWVNRAEINSWRVKQSWQCGRNATQRKNRETT